MSRRQGSAQAHAGRPQERARPTAQRPGTAPRLQLAYGGLECAQRLADAPCHLRSVVCGQATLPETNTPATAAGTPLPAPWARTPEAQPQPPRAPRARPHPERSSPHTGPRVPAKSVTNAHAGLGWVRVHACCSRRCAQPRPGGASRRPVSAPALENSQARKPSCAATNVGRAARGFAAVPPTLRAHGCTLAVAAW